MQQSPRCEHFSRLRTCCTAGPSKLWEPCYHVTKRLARSKRCTRVACEQAGADFENGEPSSTASAADSVLDTAAFPQPTCIIESRDSVKDFASLQLSEINHNIQSRRNKIFLLMEEVRRLRIQQRLKGGERSKEEEVLEERYPSVVPFLPPLTDATIRDYFQFYLSAVGAIILFGGLLAPILEVKLGMGGTSYREFITTMHLPAQLAQVDPIVASFCGGAVGVLSTLMVVEANNATAQAASRCIYCGGTGYVTCGSCGGSGGDNPANAPAQLQSAEQRGKASSLPQRALAAFERRSGPSDSAAQQECRCNQCSGTGKVMCIGCLCTGKKVAREHDPRLDPFS